MVTDSHIYRETDGWKHGQTGRQTDMINHQKPACENEKLRTFCTAGLLLNKRRRLALAVGWFIMHLFSIKILLSPTISAIFADTISYFKIMQF